MVIIWMYTTSILVSLTWGYDTRTIVQTNPAGTVALVEVARKGIIYGQCVYDDENGNEIQVSFEEYGSELLAVSDTESVQDPKKETLACRKKALVHEENFGTAFRGEGNGEAEQAASTVEELQARYNGFVKKIQRSQQFLTSSLFFANIDLFKNFNSLFNVTVNSSWFNKTKVFGYWG